ncbi:MAG TPA: hypothetical protein VFW66_11015 [Gemmatimonadales bacterium]|nr:hypothetical protein [Gemmatimonadales bacterium]
MHRWHRSIAAAFVAAAAAGAVACGGRDRGSMASADSLTRDLQLAPTDTTAALGDRAADTATAAATPAAPPAAPAPKRRSTAGASSNPSRPSPATPQPSGAAAPAAPAAPAAGASLAAGTVIRATLADSISSRRNKVGDVIEATTTSAVKDSRGRTVIPRGATVSMKITAIHESENKSDKTGTLTLEPTEVRMNGQSYPITASIDSVNTSLAGRKTGAGDIAKVGAGAGIGAVAGRVIGGGATGAIIGGVIGGAVGAQRAVETKDRDVVVPAGSSVKLTLKSPFTPTA